MIGGHDHRSLADLIVLSVASLIAWPALIGAFVWITAVRAARRHTDGPDCVAVTLGPDRGHARPHGDDRPPGCTGPPAPPTQCLTCRSAGSRTATGHLACRISCWLTEPSSRPPTAPCPRGSITWLTFDGNGHARLEAPDGPDSERSITRDNAQNRG